MEGLCRAKLDVLLSSSGIVVKNNSASLCDHSLDTTYDGEVTRSLRRQGNFLFNREVQNVILDCPLIYILSRSREQRVMTSSNVWNARRVLLTKRFGCRPDSFVDDATYGITDGRPPSVRLVRAMQGRS